MRNETFVDGMGGEASLPLVESFVSINGEGNKSGELALFLRFKGCNLNCSYCDTAWANQPDAACEYRTVSWLCELAQESGVNNVTLTGGEPLLQNNVELLIDALLRETNQRIEIETNGSVSIERWKERDQRLCFTLDYKLPGSGMEEHVRMENYAWLKPWDVVKFVCSDREDLDKARQVIESQRLTEKCSVLLSPVFGRIDPADMVEYMKAGGMRDVRLQLQMHKFIWDPNKRGV